MNKHEYKYLNIKGTVLDNYQLQNYMEKIASSHEIKSNSEKYTYPVPRLKDNFKFIEKTYELLNEHLKLKIDINPAGEWLLDNFYIIEETYKTIISEMNLKKYKNFPGIANGIYKGYSRGYVLASEIVAYTDNKVNDEVLTLVISAYQKRKLLSMEEIWNLWIFLEIALIENIRNICEKIYMSQIQKYKVENIIERLVEIKSNKSQIFSNIKRENRNYNIFKEMKYPFIEYMSYKLKRYGKQGVPYLEILEEQVNKMGMTISDVIQKEHYDVAILKVSLGNSIISLKEILRVNFLNLFEEINGVEDILKKDPANVYSNMDYKTKEYYRNEIKQISERTKISELYIAKKAVELSNKYTDKDGIENRKKSHIGYYLISEGKDELLNTLGIKSKKHISSMTKVNRYIFLIYFITTILTGLMGGYIYYTKKNIFISTIISLIMYIPISEIVQQFINYALNKKVKPTIIPKMDFSKGIPKEYATFVVIPTIVDSKEKVKEIMKKLEVYYLANKSENLYFALLGDCTSSKNENENFDDEVIKAGLEETEKLNKKYLQNFDKSYPKFNFVYRKRTWNPSEKCYLGWERKRGLLCQFNDFLVDGINKFRINTITNYIATLSKEKVQEGNTSELKSNLTSQISPLISNRIKYVITLDVDTNLSLETGLELVGAMAHILNQPILDKDRNIVINGYGLMQPRIGTNLESSRKSLFTKIYAGPRGDRFIYKRYIRYISR